MYIIYTYNILCICVRYILVYIKAQILIYMYICIRERWALTIVPVIKDRLFWHKLCLWCLGSSLHCCTQLTCGSTVRLHKVHGWSDKQPKSSDCHKADDARAPLCRHQCKCAMKNKQSFTPPRNNLSWNCTWAKVTYHIGTAVLANFICYCKF